MLSPRTVVRLLPRPYSYLDDPPREVNPALPDRLHDHAPEGHDESNDPIDALGAPLLRRFQVPRRVGLHRHVRCHPAKHWMAAVCELLTKNQLLQFLRRRGHILEALADGD